jgi:hypothetical protein
MWPSKQLLDLLSLLCMSIITVLSFLQHMRISEKLAEYARLLHNVRSDDEAIFSGRVAYMLAGFDQQTMYGVTREVLL